MDLCTKEVFDSLDQWPSTHWISGPHPFFGLRGRPSAVTEFPPVFGRPLTTETLRKHPSRRSLWRPPTGSLLTPIVPTESPAFRPSSSTFRDSGSASIPRWGCTWGRDPNTKKESALPTPRTHERRVSRRVGVSSGPESCTSGPQIDSGTVPNTLYLEYLLVYFFWGGGSI